MGHQGSPWALRTGALDQGKMPRTLMRRISMDLGSWLSFNSNSLKRMLLTNNKVTPQISIRTFRNMKSHSTLHTLNCQNRALGEKLIKNFQDVLSTRSEGKWTRDYEPFLCGLLRKRKRTRAPRIKLVIPTETHRNCRVCA